MPDNSEKMDQPASARSAGFQKQLANRTDMERGIEGIAQYIPPHSIESEQSVIGALLIQPASLDRVKDILNVYDFYRESHRYLFESMVLLAKRDVPIDLITVPALLEKHNRLVSIGGISYITSLFDSVPSAANVEFYAKIVAEKAALRRLIDGAITIVGKARDPDIESIDDLIDEAHKLVDKGSLKKSSTEGTWRKASELVLELTDIAEDAERNAGKIVGLRTGLCDLDKAIGGIQTRYHAIGARPSMAKTSLALQIAYYVARYEKKNVYYYTVEEHEQDLITRIACMEASIDSNDIANGNLDEYEWRELTRAAEVIYDIPLWFETSFDREISHLPAKINRKIRKEGPGLIIIDHIGKFRARAEREFRHGVVEVSTALSLIPGREGCPVIVLSPLKRDVDVRNPPRPTLSDFAESSSIESDVRVAMLLYRPEYYEKDELKKTPVHQVQKAELIIAKQSMGPTPTVTLGFTPKYTRFSDYIEERQTTM